MCIFYFKKKKLSVQSKRKEAVVLPEIKFSTCSELAFSSIKPNISPETACSFAWFLSKTAQLHLTGIRYLIPPRLRSIVLSILTLTGLQVVFYIINLWQTKSSRCFKVSFVSFLSLEKLLCVVSFSNKHSIPVSLKNGSRYKYWNLRFPKLKWKWNEIHSVWLRITFFINSL